MDSRTIKIPRDGARPQGPKGPLEKAPAPQGHRDDPMAFESIKAGS